MTANIRTVLHSSLGGPVVGPTVDEASRTDLKAGYEVVASSINPAVSYLWELVFAPSAPDNSTSSATLLAPENNNSQTCRFVVDYEGTYLLRLITDSGLGGEDTQYVALRFVTDFNQLKLVAPTEQKDPSENIPVDVPTSGWAGVQNINLQRILAQVRRTATSGRTLYVDANKGRDSTATPNNLNNTIALPGYTTAGDISVIAMAHGDFSSIQDAIDYAADAVARGEPALSSSDPYVIFIQPGLYEETLTLSPFVHLVGLGNRAFDFVYAGLPAAKGGVQVRTAGSAHSFNPVSANFLVTVTNITFECDVLDTYPVMDITGGVFKADGCSFIQRFADTEAPAVRITDTLTVFPFFENCNFICAIDSVPSADAWVIVHDAPGQLNLNHCYVFGWNGIAACPNGDKDNVSVQILFSQVIPSITGAAGPVSFTVKNSEVNEIDITPFGPTTVTSSLSLVASNSQLGAVVLDTGATSSTVDGSLSFCKVNSILFPSGDPNSFSSQGSPSSINYQVWSSNPHWTTGVPSVKRLSTSSGIATSTFTVQDAIDELSARIGTRIYETTNANPYTITYGKEIIGVDGVGVAFSVILPASPPVGAAGNSTQITIKDISGNAAVGNITISTTDGSLIDGAATAVISTNYGFVNLFWNGVGWFSF